MKLIEQLQIGDWIRFKETGKYAKVTAVYADSPVVDNFSETIRTNLTDTFYTADCFEPVPIGRIFLENNGFKWNDLPMCQYWECNGIIIDNYYKGTYRIRLIGNASMELRGVHDLQHVLRMVNGKENIVL